MQLLYFCSFAGAIAPISAQHQPETTTTLDERPASPRIKSDSDPARVAPRRTRQRATPPADSRRLRHPRMQKYADSLSELVVGAEQAEQA
jgi:hypothetical protein